MALWLQQQDAGSQKLLCVAVAPHDYKGRYFLNCVQCQKAESQVWGTAVWSNTYLDAVYRRVLLLLLQPRTITAASMPKQCEHSWFLRPVLARCNYSTTMCSMQASEQMLTSSRGHLVKPQLPTGTQRKTYYLHSQKCKLYQKSLFSACLEEESHLSSLYIHMMYPQWK